MPITQFMHKPIKTFGRGNRLWLQGNVHVWWQSLDYQPLHQEYSWPCRTCKWDKELKYCNLTLFWSKIFQSLQSDFLHQKIQNCSLALQIGTGASSSTNCNSQAVNPFCLHMRYISSRTMSVCTLYVYIEVILLNLWSKALLLQLQFNMWFPLWVTEHSFHTESNTTDNLYVQFKVW